MDKWNEALNVAGPATLDRGQETGIDFGAAEVTAATDSSNATIKANYSLSKRAPSQSHGIFHTLTLTGSAPIGKGSDRTELATLDGFRNAFSFALKYTRLSLSGIANPLEDPAKVKRNDEICAELTETVRRQTGDNKAEPDCETGNVSKFLPGRFEEFKRLFFDPNGAAYSLGIEPKVGYKKFDFIDATMLSKLSDSKVPWGISAFWGVTKMQTLFTVGGNYQKGFKDADQGILCPSSSGSGTVTCKTGPVGKPVDDDAELAYIEVRHRFNIPMGRQFMSAGISLKVTHDFKQDLTGVDLPIVFIKDKDGKLTGGVRAGWTTTGHWQAGVFVGSAFSLFNG